MMAQIGKQTILVHIFSIISRSKGNQALKFGQLIEYNMSNMFLKISKTYVVVKLFPEPFLKNRNCAYLDK